MNFFTPWFFLLLLSIPILIIIYKLKNKHKVLIVSSLFLWQNQTVSKKGGTVFKQLPLPLLFFIELLIFILIGFAAATPFILSKDKAYPLWIILDDSYSMRAGDKNSAKSKGELAIIKEVNRINGRTVRFILAGSDINTIGGDIKSNEELKKIFSQWKCASIKSSLVESIGFVKQLGGNISTIMVITDQPPLDNKLIHNNVLWKSFGKSTSNIAFVNVARTSYQDKERCLFEIANISTEPRQIKFKTLYSLNGVEQKSMKILTMQANETKKIIMSIPYKSSALFATLDDDELDIDNSIVVLPNRGKPITIKLDFANEQFKGLVEKAIKSINKTINVTENPQLLFTDKQFPPKVTENLDWIYQFIIDKKPTPYVGPFIQNKSHPLLNGIDMGGIIWASGKNEKIEGNPIISAGSIPLLTDIKKPHGQHHILLRFNPDYSNLHNTPNWPILIWNAINWRLSTSPGIRKFNYRLGENIDIITDLNNSKQTTFSIIKPDKTTINFNKSIEKFRYNPKQIGIYQVNDEDVNYKFTVNPLSFQESNLLQCKYGTWNTWDKDGGLLENYKNVLWLFLLPAFLLMILHQYLIRKIISD